MALQGGRQGIPAGHPEVCRSPGVPELGSGPRKTGGGEEGVPLGGREGQMATVGVLGVPDVGRYWPQSPRSKAFRMAGRGHRLYPGCPSP